MPIHDWTRVRANRFHAFHQDWTVEIARSLNRGLLPDGFSALAEQRTGRAEGDVVTLSTHEPDTASGGISLLEKPVNSRIQQTAEISSYADRANIVRIEHPDGHIVAVVEIVSPGNKDRKLALRQFVRKALRYLKNGIHLLIVDVFPPNPISKRGIHSVIWNELGFEAKPLPSGQPLAAISYRTLEETCDAFVEPFSVGDILPDMPIFLGPDRYVMCPLEASYQTSWEVYPVAMKTPLTAP